MEGEIVSVIEAELLVMEGFLAPSGVANSPGIESTFYLRPQQGHSFTINNTCLLYVLYEVVSFCFNPHLFSCL